MVKATRQEKLKADRDDLIARGVQTLTGLFIARADGYTIRDVDGREYLDFTGGIGVHTTGHRPDPVIRAVRDQLEKYLHLCVMVFNYEPYVELARRLRSIAPIRNAKSAFFNAGAEAIENAVKVARAHTKRPGVISFQDSFHGRTLLTLSLTGRYEPYKVGFEPFVPHVYQATFPYHYRCPPGHAESECASLALDSVDAIFRSQASADRVAALVVEPVQGEGGFIVPPKDFLPGLRRMCDDHGIVLVDDEIQAGLGRTGRMFAIEHFGVEPDVVCTAKALGGGLPISGVTGRPEIMDAPVPGSLGGTFGGNPLSCIAAIENLKIIQSALPMARTMARTMSRRLEEMADRHGLVGDVRGLGPMQALEFVRDRRTKEPAREETKAIQREAMERGLLLLTAGRYDNVVRLMPPITTPLSTLEKGFDILDVAIASVEKARR